MTIQETDVVTPLRPKTKGRNNTAALRMALGYRKLGLTPGTGDIFMDHHIFRKLASLDDPTSRFRSRRMSIA